MKRIDQTRMEWALLAIIALVCAVLSFLQYRWAGELSKAEPALIRTGLNEQLRRLTEEFNNDIRESCVSLVPTADETANSDKTGLLRNLYERWASSHDRKMFSRVGLVVAENAGVALYGVDTAGRVDRIEWPADWMPLRDAMQSRLEHTGRPPNVSPNSDLIDIPIFAHAGPEIAWMIFQIDENYVGSSLLPRLVTEYLNPAGADYDVSVSAGAARDVIYSTRSDGESVAANADATAGLLPVDIGDRGGRGRGFGRGRDPGRGARWLIAVRHHAGSLEVAVAAVRRRNLVVSLILVGLLGGTAWALVQYTAGSRRLADMQLQFAAGISHDLRTPLTAIRGAAFNLVEGVVKEPTAVVRYLRLILRNTDELTAMIENVLAFSATLRASKHDHPEAIAVGDVLRHAVDVMTPEIEQAGCRIEINIPGELPSVAADPIAVELAFRNLIGNAARHGVGGKWIGVSAVPSGETVEVRVCDHGPGICDQETKRIFEPFYRGNRTRTQQIPGTGLGLSLVKNTIERYKGTVEVNNSPDGGAQFTVRLPVIQPST
ncbi:MAG: HAMP domain-containing histidine kinase [Acidobacteriia bacterium]|nr:HAMP domain-containing histidine kinase [Terriglobia bacterium]